MGRQSLAGVVAEVNLRIELQRLSEQAMERGDGPLAAILGAAVRTVDERIAEAEAMALQLPSDDGGPGLICRNVRVHGRRTSVKLEQEFWDALEELAQHSHCAVNDLCDAAARLKGQGSLTSAIRVYVLRSVKQHARAMIAA